MTLEQAIKEWGSKKRRMGCRSASNWLCKRVFGFYPKTISRYTEHGDLYQHVVATNGLIIVDLVPHLDAPKKETKHGKIL